jgi:hypothetical protein
MAILIIALEPQICTLSDRSGAVNVAYQEFSSRVLRRREEMAPLLATNPHSTSNPGPEGHILPLLASLVPI